MKSEKMAYARSASSPELGKERNPLDGYDGGYYHSVISYEEEDAELLYYGLVSAAVPKQAFQILAKDLSRRSRDAGAYLTFLIYRSQQSWPSIK